MSRDRGTTPMELSDAVDPQGGPAPVGLVTAALWVGGAVVVALLLVQRYRGAIGAAPLQGGSNVDFRSFLEGARNVAAGGSPYDGSDAYTYFAPLSLLLAPFAHADAVGVLKGWTVLGLGAFTTALALTVWALRDRLGAPWQAPVVFTAGAVIGLHSWPLVYELFLGNDDLLVLLGVVVAALVWRTGRPVWFGVAVGAICLIKVWPALLIVAVLQAGTGARKRLLAVTALAGVVLVGFISNLVPAGGREFTAFYRAVGQAKALPLVSDSVSGIPTLLFSRTGLAQPVVVSGGLRFLFTGLLGVWVIGLLVVVLRRPGERLLCVFNTALFTVLIIPVSHMCYSVLALPVVWFWLANFRVFLERRRRRGGYLVLKVAVVGAVAAWALLQSKGWPGDGSAAGLSSLRFCVVFAANLGLYSASVAGGRFLLDGASPGPPDPVARADQADETDEATAADRVVTTA